MYRLAREALALAPSLDLLFCNAGITGDAANDDDDAIDRLFAVNLHHVRILAGDLLPNSTREQTLATGFLRNHMINGEGGRIAAENRVDYVLDMTETTGSICRGSAASAAIANRHPRKPIHQRVTSMENPLSCGVHQHPSASLPWESHRGFINSPCPDAPAPRP